MITPLFLRSPSIEYLSFHIWYFNTGVINREDYKRRILSSCSSFPAAEQNLVCHAKLPSVHFFFPVLDHNTAASSVNAQSLQKRLTVLLEE